MTLLTYLLPQQHVGHRRESLGLPPERPVSPASSVRSARSCDGDTSTSEETSDQVRVRRSLLQSPEAAVHTSFHHP